MSGHSHWAGIKHKKGATDQKRGELFGKLLNAVSIAAKTELNPDFNPRLRAAIDKAKEAGVPKDKIDAAIKRASDSSSVLEELLFEAYGPGGAAMLIEAASDSRNRTVADVKKILNELGGKWAEPGSVAWAFEKTPGGWTGKFWQELKEEDRNGLRALVEALEKSDGVQRVYTNAKG
jgi:YebC/PmpR family DNA-binding regulatory protein